MKKKDKKILIIVITVMAILLVIGFRNQLNFFTIYSQDNLGNWVGQYDSFNDKMVIPIDLSVPTSGGLGPSYMQDTGLNMDESTCNRWLLGYRDADSASSAGGFRCYLPRNPSIAWFNNKTYTSDVSCTHSVGSPQIEKYQTDFNGFYIGFDNLKRQGDDTVSCKGTITVKIGGNNIMPPNNTYLWIVGILVIIGAGFYGLSFKKRK